MQPPGGAAEAGQDKGGEAGAKAVSRKIIYTAEVEVIAEDFAAAEKKLTELVKTNKGYLSKADVGISPGRPRVGRWKVRVPVDRFDAFLDAAAGLGELQKRTLDSQDVTDEFYDLKARIRNKQKEEERLLEHLQKSTGKLQDILAVEEALSRVRGEVERLQGQAERLANLSSLATVNVTVHERSTYVPPEAAGFWATVGRTFTGSVDLLVQFGQALVLLGVALAPWLTVLLLLGVPALLFLRWRRPVVAVAAPPAPPREELPTAEEAE